VGTVGASWGSRETGDDTFHHGRRFHIRITPCLLNDSVSMVVFRHKQVSFTTGEYSRSLKIIASIRRDRKKH